MNLDALRPIAVWIVSVGFFLGFAAPAIVFPRSRRSAVARAFFWWLFAGAVSNGLGLVFAKLFHSNAELYKVYRLTSVALLAWIAHLSFPGEKTRRGITVAAAAYAALWTTVWAMGLEPRGTFAIYTSPGEKLVNVIVGVMLISSAISNSAFPPLRQAASWLGIGLVLAGATGIAAYPLSQAMQAASPAHSWMVKPFASIFGHVGLVLWCIPYWKKNVVWTQ